MGLAIAFATLGVMNNSAQRITILATGGTISCTHDEKGLLVPTLTSEDLAAPLRRELADEFPNLTISAEDYSHLDSSQIGGYDYDRLNERIATLLADDDLTAIIVTHGTDSLAETALAIDMHNEDPRPIILTCAQRPADDDAADGPENLLDAARIALSPSARDIGSLIVCGHSVIPACGAMKVHTSDVVAFATRAPVEQPRIRARRQRRFADHRVEIFYAYPGAEATGFAALLETNPDGIVVAAMGSGNVSEAVANHMRSAAAAGMPIVLASEVPYGAVSATYGGAGGGGELLQQGIVSARFLSPTQARIALLAGLSDLRQDSEVTALEPFFTQLDSPFM